MTRVSKVIRELRRKFGLDENTGKPLNPPDPPSDPSGEPPYFTCPRCGSHHFGRDTINTKDGVVTCKTVRCHGDGCKWRGEWPPVDSAGLEAKLIETPAISAIATALRNGKTPCKPCKPRKRRLAEVVEREVQHDPAALIVWSLKIAACCGAPWLRDEYSRLAAELSKAFHISDEIVDDPRETV